MELLSASRQEAVRQIREQLRCVLCECIFEDPQCLDCKHNFCRECIFLHLRKNNSHCPTCRLPTRPSEVTRNQFLESILAAWKTVEVELEHLDDPQCHEGSITVADTERALQSASAGSHLSAPVVQNGAGSVGSVAMPMSMQGRGRVANNKWNIDTQGIRQEMRHLQPYGYGQPSSNGNSKSSSSDLPDNYGASQRQTAESTTPARSQRQRRRGKTKRRLPITASTEEDEGERSSDSASQGDRFFTHHLTALSLDELSQASSSAMLQTQDINTYLERINKQREALNKWERERAKRESAGEGLGLAEASLALPRLPVLSQNRNGHGISTCGDSQTQLPLSAMGYDSPDLLPRSQVNAFDRLLSRARTSRRIDDSEDEDDGDVATEDPDEWLRSRLAKRRTQTEAEHSQQVSKTEDGSARKRVCIPSSQRLEDVERPVIRVESSQLEVDDESDEPIIVPDSQTVESAEEELEMKASVPITRNSSPPKRSVLEAAKPAKSPNSALGKRHAKRISQDFAGAIKAFQAKQQELHRPSSAAAAALMPRSTPSDVEASHLQASSGIVSSTVLQNSEPPSSIKESEPLSKLNRPPLASKTEIIPPVVKSEPVSWLSRLPVSTSGSVPAKKSESNGAYVLVGTDLSKDEIRRVVEACGQLGGRFGRHFDTKRNRLTGSEFSSVTHVITKTVPPPYLRSDGEPFELPGRRCKRTAKYMQALAEGSFVVDVKWVWDSVSTGKWLSENSYEMDGDVYSDAMGKPRESRLRRARTGRRNDIFNMFRFVMLCQDDEFDFQLDSVGSVVKTFGGVVSTAGEFDSLNATDRLSKTPIGIVSKTLPSWIAKARWQQYQIPIVRVTWIFDSISFVEVLPFDDYYPY